MNFLEAAKAMKEVNLIHKKVSDKEIITNLKKLHKKHPDIFMSPNEWKKKREDERRNV